MRGSRPFCFETDGNSWEYLKNSRIDKHKVPCN